MCRKSDLLLDIYGLHLFKILEYNPKLVKEQDRKPQHQGLTREEITESPISLPEVMQVANLKPEELQATRLLHQAREKGKELSKRDLTENLYPEENFQIAIIKLRVDLHGANSKLRPFGWRIDHPLHHSQGKVRKIRDRYVILGQDEILEIQLPKSAESQETLERQRNPKKTFRKSSPRDSLPTLPRAFKIQNHYQHQRQFGNRNKQKEKD